MTTPCFVAGITGHIFYQNGPDETVRFIYDWTGKTFCAAQVLHSLGWCDLDEDGQADMHEWLRQYTLDALVAEGEVDVFTEKPCWEDLED